MLSPKAPMKALHIEPQSHYKLNKKDEKLRTIDVNFVLPDIGNTTKP